MLVRGCVFLEDCKRRPQATLCLMNTDVIKNLSKLLYVDGPLAFGGAPAGEGGFDCVLGVFIFISSILKMLTALLSGKLSLLN